MRPLLFATLLLLTSCRPSSQQDVTPALIVAGAAEITREDFERSYVARLISNGENDTRLARSLHLNNLIDAELLSQEARRLGLDQDSAGSRRIETLRKKAVGDVYFEREFLSRLEPPDEEEIRQAFARWKERAIVRHLYYRDSTEAVAAYDRLLSGVPFLDEAQRCYGTATYDSSAGYLGPIGYFEVDDAFAEAAFALRQHEFSRPVRSRFGYHIILLEDRLQSPLLTESEFQARRDGISSKWRMRKRTLEGDRFVRSFMQNLGVEVNADAIELLSETIALIEKRVTAETPRLSMDERRPEPTGELRASTPLAWYTFRGQDRVFTLADYAAWFDELPFQEARHRTAASVGRALRNEALALAGEAQGLGADPVTLHEIGFHERIYLAGRMRDLLRERARETVTDEQAGALISEMNGAEPVEVFVDFWEVHFDSRREAETALAAIRNGTLHPGSLAGYRSYDRQPLSGSSRQSDGLKRAPLNVPVLTVDASGTWSILSVARRQEETMDQEQRLSVARERLAPLIAERELLERLRSEAVVRVDTTMFEAMAPVMMNDE
ncbi:MAG TPA: peptidylprolyl isomerase [Rhodothermia bacterium]